MIKASGVAYSMAQYGEQLAWLGSSLRPSIEDQVVQYTPSITQISKFTFKIDAVEKQFQHPSASRLLQALSRPGSSSGIAPPCIVQGYPTARRYENYLGLEVSYESLKRFAPGISAVAEVGNGVDTDIQLLDSEGRIKLVEAGRSICLWHYHPDNFYLCACRSSELNKIPSGAPGQIPVSQYRHVIQLCENVKALHRTEESRHADGDKSQATRTSGHFLSNLVDEDSVHDTQSCSESFYFFRDVS